MLAFDIFHWLEKKKEKKKKKGMRTLGSLKFNDEVNVKIIHLKRTQQCLSVMVDFRLVNV